MDKKEYETELKVLYGKAIKQESFSLALEILERGRAIGLEGIAKEPKKRRQGVSDND